jgi:anti-sigma regulatory factor (Ser/Thr protein kinase)
MSANADAGAATLNAFRYVQGEAGLRVIIGEHAPAGEAELVLLAINAMDRRAFICHTATPVSETEADELCFVPLGDHCEILSIRTNGWHRHHGDHRRSLVEILNEIAAAVARGRLRLLDDRELEAELAMGQRLLSCTITDSTTLTAARAAVDLVLKDLGLDADSREKVVLGASEAATNMLLHGGGGGVISLRRAADRLRVVVADSGPGLNFLNWIGPPQGKAQASMGYGYKIILEHLAEVYLHTTQGGTTLILDRKVTQGV